MARPLRIEFPGALYHVISRGNERREIVRDDADRHKRLDWLRRTERDLRLSCRVWSQSVPPGKCGKLLFFLGLWCGKRNRVMRLQLSCDWSARSTPISPS